MKVLLLCMAFAAVSLAMPVAEEKQDVPVVPASVPEVKSEDAIKPEIEKEAVPVEEKKSDVAPAPETKAADKPVEPEAKSADKPIDATPEVQPEAKVEAVPEVKKEIIPEIKESAPVSTEPELKPEISQAVEPKPEEKSAQPETKTAPVEESKPEESQAKVEEITAPVAKSAIPDVVIDVVNAVKNPAAIADDVVDPAAISPSSDPQPIVSGKSANPEDNKEDKQVKAAAPESSAVDASEKKLSVEPKSEEKPAEIATPSDASAAPKTAAVSDDSTRVIRDAVEEKKDSETPQAEAKTVAEAIKDEVKPAEVQVDAKSAKPTEDVQALKENEPESPKVEQPTDAAKDVKSIEIPKDKEDKEVVPLAQPIDAVKEDAKPEVKSEETILNDAPAKAKNSSEESAESSEKNESTEKDSSEESGEKSKENAPKP
ncbi:protein bangles and beads-like [Vanessa cardui]|uniref:protein bangles and beads-like n=1 Tax=Vanessa cardui TaxID=171605 RepID=UPI001F12E748|nr:protein bangles and beads-like [Vanessa cardui]